MKMWLTYQCNMVHYINKGCELLCKIKITYNFYVEKSYRTELFILLWYFSMWKGLGYFISNKYRTLNILKQWN